MADKINQEVLDQLLVEVTSEIAEYLKKDEADLRKAADEDEGSAPAEESEGSEGPAAPEASASEEGSAPEGPPPPDASAAPEAPAAPEGVAAPDAQGEIEPAPTVEGLQAEYMKLDPEALKMHYLACKSALMAQMGAGPEASAAPAPEASGAPAPAASAPAAPPAAPEASAPMAMGEMKSSGKQIEGSPEANGGEIKAGSKLGKSEIQLEIEALKAKLAKAEETSKEQEAQLLELAMKLTAPLRKSIKGVSELAFVAKEGQSEKKSPVAGLSKNEVVAKLREKARGDLKKSDRDLITAYTMGNVDVSKIEHLLVEISNERQE